MRRMSDGTEPLPLRGGGPIRRFHRSEDGFGVLEAMASIVVLAFVMLGMALVVGSSLRARTDVTQFEQATAIGNKLVEGGRNISFEKLTMVTSDIAADSKLTSTCVGLTGTRFLDPDGSGPLKCEQVVHSSAGGLINPHITTETVDGKAFTVKRYVSWVDSAAQGGIGQNYKRLTVIVEWTVGGRETSYETSAFIAEARRGLPVPKFELSPSSQTKTVEQGNVAIVPFSITNRGITDAYDITLPVPAGRSWTIRLYKDVNQNAGYDAGTDTLLTDTNGTGVVDTNTVLTDATVHVIARWTLGASEATGTVPMTLTVKSGADAAVIRTGSITMKIEAPGVTLYLHNYPTPPIGDTTARANLVMDATIPTATVDSYKYSTNYYSGQPGRWIDRSSATHSESNLSRMQNWIYQVPAPNTIFDGTATVKLWVAMKDFNCALNPSITVFIRRRVDLASHSGTQLGSATASAGTGSCGFRLVEFQVPLSSASVPQNQYLELKVKVNTSSNDAALIHYDTVTYTSTIKLPQVSS